MRGYRVERRFGWDTHGLPVEYEVEQALKLNGRHEIELFGEGKFNEECRSIVLRYTSEWRETVDRMARWVDFKNDYKTMDIDFMESVWWVFKSLWEKGLIYEGVKVVPYSWRVSTPLSNFEANLNYKDIQDPSVTLRFKVRGEENLYFLAWTTTPWTLPSNRAVAVNKELDYALVRFSGGLFLLAHDLVESCMNSYEVSDYSIVANFRGDVLEGIILEHPFYERLVPIVLAEHVTVEAGTGLVHTAPAHGLEDFEAGLKNDLEIDLLVDDHGVFRDDVPIVGGLHFSAANNIVIEELTARQKLIRANKYLHSYPVC